MPKVTMPQLGESVAEGTIGKWLKQVGDHVDKYEPIVEVITDKVNAEVPSPFEGTLTQILVQEGETVPNGAEIAVIEGAAEGTAPASAQPPEPPAAATSEPAAAATSEPAAAAATPEAPAAAGPAAAVTPEPPARPAPAPAPAAQTPTPAGTGSGDGSGERTVLGTGFGPAGSDERRVEEMRPAASAATAAGGATAAPSYEGRVTPAVRRIAREHGIDLNLVAGSGHAGRVTREDVMAYVEQQRTGAASTSQASRAQAPAAPAASSAQAPIAQAPSPPAPSGQVLSAPPAPATPPSGAGDSLRPMTPMRKAIASQMTRALSAPVAYTTIEVDVSGMVAAREAVKAAYRAREGIGLSYVAFVTKATVEALRRHPDLNGHWTDEGLLRRGQINIGIAVAVDDGLVVPVIHGADGLSLHGLNRAINDLAERARANRLRLDDIQGSTFTVDNTGWTGSNLTQPILNVPEVGILTMEAIVKRPVVIETPQGDTIGIRPMMNMCLGFDHRATDGAQAGRFVQDVRRWLEAVDAETPIW
ncbi:MAG TPA: dihydrolipoamide acetyltransferase family protein [Candidatus Limnocylindrales bacterium]|nr:dihydrolipoamide acetyltransferase family protein [Candidatus Limnocylindrales bacterium]